MNSSELARGLAQAAVLSGKDYRVVYPLKVHLFSTLPRAVVQVLFFSYIGYYGGGEAGRTFAFVGACTHIMVIAAVVRGSDVLADERTMGTLYRLRLGVLPLPAVVLVRWWVFVCEGVLCAWAAAAAGGLVLGDWAATGLVFACTPLLLLVGMTLSAFGSTLGGLSLMGEDEVLWSNLASYALLVLCGVVAPLSALGQVGEIVARLLPMTNGLLAIRALGDGRPWAGAAIAEAAVGVGWFAASVLVLAAQDLRARTAGIDEGF